MCGKFIFIFTRRPQDFLMVDVHDNFLFFTMRPRDFLVVGLCDNIFNFYHETMYYPITMYYCIILWAIIVKFTTRRRASRDEKAQNGQCWNYLNSSALKDNQMQYSAIDCEVLGLKFAVDTNAYYLYGAKCINIYTDTSATILNFTTYQGSQIKSRTASTDSPDAFERQNISISRNPS